MRAAEIRARLAAIIASYRPKHLVHVGGHDGEELGGYLAAGVDRITVVEPIRHLAARIRTRHPNVTVLEVACSDRDGVATLHLPARTNMASLHPVPGTTGTITVPTRRLDELTPDADAVVVDVQGHEFQVLAAAPWESLRVLVVEALDGVADPTVAPPLHEVTALAEAHGMRPVAGFGRSYDAVMRWATGRQADTGGRIVDVVYARADGHTGAVYVTPTRPMGGPDGRRAEPAADDRPVDPDG